MIDDLTDNPAESEDAQTETESLLFSARSRLVCALIAGGLLLVGVVLRVGFDEIFGRWLEYASLGIGLFFGTRAAWGSVRELKLDIDVLMVLGAIAAAPMHPAEGALLMFLFVLSGAMEELASERTRREIEALDKLMPSEAIMFRDDEWVGVSPGELAEGDRIKIRPGDAIPADATLERGESLVDLSALTGESVPREVVAGDELYAGTINLSSAMEAIVLRPASASSLQRVLDLVMQARKQREPIQRLIDRVSQPYSWAVLVSSLVVFLVWWLALGFTLGDAGMTAITLLIVMSPCAVMIATPTVTLAAIGRGARTGVLFKGGQAIDRLSRVGAICFDKTGTLTEGRPKISQTHALGWSNEESLIALAAGLEADSTHPIAQAIRELAEQRGIEPAHVDDVTNIPGKGLAGSAAGTHVRLGSLRHVEEVVPTCLRAQATDILSEAQQRGSIGVVVARGGEDGDAAVFIMSDPVRLGARDAVESLRTLGLGPVRMLTGDNKGTAAAIAECVGVDDWRAELFPEDKVREIEEMKRGAKQKNKKQPGVAFVGDGVNDAPALAAADVGIAIGSIGSEAALESADVVLLSDNLAGTPWAIRLARRARSILRFNMTLALTLIVGMAIATLVGSLTGRAVSLSIGVLAHEGGTVFVVLNALRLLWAADPPSPTKSSSDRCGCDEQTVCISAAAA